MTNYAASLAWWLAELRRWRTAVDVRSLPNVARLVRGSWTGPAGSGGQLLSIRMRGRRAPILFARYGASDIEALKEVLRDRICGDLSNCMPPRYILDCGANVGYSSAYFLRTYPDGRVLAIEPDRGNYELCRLNLRAEIAAGRAVVLRAALWHRDERLLISNQGPEWARTVGRAAAMAEGGDWVEGYPLSKLIEISGFPRIDLLKIDIEGAELQVFEHGISPELLHSVATIAIELHGPECRRVFLSALPDDTFELRHSGAYVIATNRRWPQNLPVTSSVDSRATQ
jgi:FkbM family methyltransferase